MTNSDLTTHLTTDPNTDPTEDRGGNATDATSHHIDQRTRLLLDRRNLLRVSGMVALAGGGAAALAACAPATPTAAPSSAAPSSAASSSTAPSSAAPSSAAPSSASPSSAPSSSASSAAVPKGPSVSAKDVPVGSGVIMEDADYVVTQPTKGDFKAFTKICTHQQCAVTEISGDAIICKCHGSEFSIKDGSVLQSPADEPLKEFKTTVAGGKVVVDA